MRQQGGWTMMEIMVVVIITTIAAVIAIPQFTGAKKSAKNADSRNKLTQSYEIAQDYYSGDSRNSGNTQLLVNSDNSYTNMNAAALGSITGSLTWTNQTTATALTPSGSANPGAMNVFFYDTAGSSATCAPTGTNPISTCTTGGQNLQICNANATYVYCVVDVGTGPQYGAATTNSSAARANALNSTAISSGCVDKILLAEKYATTGGC